MWHCRACGLYYDGNAQCCFELDHIYIPSDLYERRLETLRVLNTFELCRDVKETIYNQIFEDYEPFHRIKYDHIY